MVLRGPASVSVAVSVHTNTTVAAAAPEEGNGEDGDTARDGELLPIDGEENVVFHINGNFRKRTSKGKVHFAEEGKSISSTELENSFP